MAVVYKYFKGKAGSKCKPGRLLPGVVFALAGMQAIADTYTYQAISDFEDINAGVVPYYLDTTGGRDVLAIDAAVVAYREKFARATTMFSGNSGTFDVSITTLGEIDGEGEFRFLVNGVLAGSANNELVDEDWGEQVHVFENIEIQAGDLIAVESDARSNGLIPENGEYAFARGRWRQLELAADDALTANPVSTNLLLSVTAEPEQVELTEFLAVLVNVANIGANTVTNPVVEVTVSDGLQFVSADGCTQGSSGAVISCTLEEITAAATTLTGLAFIATEVGTTTVSAQVSADQADTDSSNNSAQTQVQVIAGEDEQTIAIPGTSATATASTSDSAAVAGTVASGVNALNNESAQSPAGTQSAAATGSSGGSGLPSLLLHLSLLFGLLLRQRLLSCCQ